jgi:hypothetical protein
MAQNTPRRRGDIRSEERKNELPEPNDLVFLAEQSLFVSSLPVSYSKNHT